jgi:CheY-like chemotaxis protein
VADFSADPLDRKPAGQWTAPLRVLVVDDIELNRELVSLRMLQRNHRVHLATDGAQAVERYLQEALDVVLMDAHMPNMNGFDAIRAIRTHEQGTGGHLPIIMLTASVLASDRKLCLDAGADAFVPKPIDFRLLFDRIADFFPVIDRPLEPDREAPLPSATHALGLIDEAAGIQNWSDRDIYYAWLVRLATDHPDIHQTVAALARDGKVQEAMEYLHTLKGLLGNLCIRRLPQVCAAIEREFKANGSLPADLMEELRRLELRLRQDIDKIRAEAHASRAVSAAVAPSPGTAIDIDAAVSLLGQIIPSLEAGELDDAALASLGERIGAQKTKKLLDAVGDFNFGAAVLAARALLDGLGQPGAPGLPSPADAQRQKAS